MPTLHRPDNWRVGLLPFRPRAPRRLALGVLGTQGSTPLMDTAARPWTGWTNRPTVLHCPADGEALLEQHLAWWPPRRDGAVAALLSRTPDAGASVANHHDKPDAELDQAEQALKEQLPGWGACDQHPCELQHGHRHPEHAE